MLLLGNLEAFAANTKSVQLKTEPACSCIACMVTDVAVRCAVLSPVVMRKCALYCGRHIHRKFLSPFMIIVNSAGCRHTSLLKELDSK